MEPPATSSLTDVAMRGLRRSVLLMSQYTVRYKAWCASALRRALRVCSSTCSLVSVLRLSAVSLSVCVQPALLWGTAMPNLHYSGICLNSPVSVLSRPLSTGVQTFYLQYTWHLHYSTSDYRGPSTVVICDTVSQISPLLATPRCVRGRHPRLSQNQLTVCRHGVRLPFTQLFSQSGPVLEEICCVLKQPTNVQTVSQINPFFATPSCVLGRQLNYRLLAT